MPVPGTERKRLPQARYHKTLEGTLHERSERMLRKGKPELAEKQKASRSGEHKANDQRMFQEETERIGRNEREN